MATVSNRTMLPDRGPLKCKGTGRRSGWRIVIVRGFLELKGWHQDRIVVPDVISIITVNVSLAADILCRCCDVIATAGLEMQERRSITTAVSVGADVIRGQEGRRTYTKNMFLLSELPTNNLRRIEPATAPRARQLS